MDPTTAMAPTHTVREAFTKPSTNCLSRLFPVLIFSHVPNRSKSPSMLISSPIRAPRQMLPVTRRDLPLASPSCSILSIPSMAPAIPINSTHTPQDTFTVSWHRSVRKRPKRIPSIPAATMAPAFMIVPKPGIFCHSPLFFVLIGHRFRILLIQIVDILLCL